MRVLVEALQLDTGLSSLVAPSSDSSGPDGAQVPTSISVVLSSGVDTWEGPDLDGREAGSDLETNGGDERLMLASGIGFSVQSSSDAHLTVSIFARFGHGEAQTEPKLVADVLMSTSIVRPTVRTNQVQLEWNSRRGVWVGDVGADIEEKHSTPRIARRPALTMKHKSDLLEPIPSSAKSDASPRLAGVSPRNAGVPPGNAGAHAQTAAPAPDDTQAVETKNQSKMSAAQPQKKAAPLPGALAPDTKLSRLLVPGFDPRGWLRSSSMPPGIGEHTVMEVLNLFLDGVAAQLGLNATLETSTIPEEDGPEPEAEAAAEAASTMRSPTSTTSSRNIAGKRGSGGGMEIGPSMAQLEREANELRLALAEKSDTAERRGRRCEDMQRRLEEFERQTAELKTELSSCQHVRTELSNCKHLLESSHAAADQLSHCKRDAERLQQQLASATAKLALQNGSANQNGPAEIELLYCVRSALRKVLLSGWSSAPLVVGCADMVEIVHALRYQMQWLWRCLRYFWDSGALLKEAMDEARRTPRAVASLASSGEPPWPEQAMAPRMREGEQLTEVLSNSIAAWQRQQQQLKQEAQQQESQQQAQLLLQSQPQPQSEPSPPLPELQSQPKLQPQPEPLPQQPCTAVEINVESPPSACIAAVEPASTDALVRDDAPKADSKVGGKKTACRRRQEPMATIVQNDAQPKHEPQTETTWTKAEARRDESASPLPGESGLVPLPQSVADAAGPPERIPREEMQPEACDNGENEAGMHLCSIAERWVAECDLRPVTAAGAVDYPCGVSLLLSDYGTILSPVASANGPQRFRMLQSIQDRAFLRSLFRTYEACDVHGRGYLTWQNYSIHDFIVDAFRRLQLSPPNEGQTYRLFAAFDVSHKMMLNARECLCLADAIFRAIFIRPPKQSIRQAEEWVAGVAAWQPISTPVLLYPCGSEIDFEEFRQGAAPGEFAEPASERVQQLADSFQSGSILRSALHAYRSCDRDFNGFLMWDGGEVVNVVQVVFHSLNLDAPGEVQVRRLFERFAADAENSVNALECLSMVDALLRLTLFGCSGPSDTEDVEQDLRTDDNVEDVNMQSVVDEIEARLRTEVSQRVHWPTQSSAPSDERPHMRGMSTSSCDTSEEFVIEHTGSSMRTHAPTPSVVPSLRLKMGDDADASQAQSRSARRQAEAVALRRQLTDRDVQIQELERRLVVGSDHNSSPSSPSFGGTRTVDHPKGILQQSALQMPTTWTSSYGSEGALPAQAEPAVSQQHHVAETNKRLLEQLRVQGDELNRLTQQRVADEAHRAASTHTATNSSCSTWQWPASRPERHSSPSLSPAIVGRRIIAAPLQGGPSSQSACSLHAGMSRSSSGAFLMSDSGGISVAVSQPLLQNIMQANDGALTRTPSLSSLPGTNSPPVPVLCMPAKTAVPKVFTQNYVVAGATVRAQAVQAASGALGAAPVGPVGGKGYITPRTNTVLGKPQTPLRFVYSSPSAAHQRWSPARDGRSVSPPPPGQVRL